ncbi:uncharacterized protein LOC131168243 [Malania oleifera]|uniref:uncharacterized protein LOC131168243 n=1 Tax=Malania oleifera TaxID=397392 RepID=UPI0025AE0587|nr:uncharacterized protein LOC131168243 [Malania oleifera]XP_057983528.1 uncharacterized protein LOC131168243 [Malania oleifera]
MDDLPLQKIAVSGPTLASMIQRLSTSPGDFDGLLFGRVAHELPCNLPDDDPSSAPSDDPSALVATVTGFFCSTATTSFYDSAGRLRSPVLRRVLADRAPGLSLLGWFSGRRRTPLRPSMRESLVSHSLSSAFQSSFPLGNSLDSFNFRPCVFILLATPLSEQIIHTHEYRAYQYSLSTDSFDPKSINIINLGPAFRGHYGAFNPCSPFPALSCELRSSSSVMVEDKDEESVSHMKQMSKDQQELDMCAKGFQIGNLSRLMGSDAANYMSGVEDLYEKMLVKLEGLARLVEQSSAKVLEQENQNMRLRYKVAALD